MGAPASILKACSYPGCYTLLPSPGPSRCPKHESLRRSEWRAREQEYLALYQDPRWNAERIAFLRTHPFCASPRHAGRFFTATIVDHHIAHQGDLALFWDRNNWVSLCVSCHNAKSAKELNAYRKAHKP